MVFNIVAGVLLAFWWWVMVVPFFGFIKRERNNDDLWLPWSLLMLCLQAVTLVYVYSIFG